MVYKTLDERPEIAELKRLEKLSTSPKQKELIQQTLKKLINGQESEKNNEYLLSFAVKDSKRIYLLSDIRLEYNGRVAQFDHILITPLGIEILESKSFKGELTITEDNSLTVKYGNKTTAYSNPIEQNLRHKKVLAEWLKEYIAVGKRLSLTRGIPIETAVLIHPETVVTNKKLPSGFYRSDSYMSMKNDEIDSEINPIKLFTTILKVISIETIENIAATLCKEHKPIYFDYTKKFPISNKNTVEVTEISREEPLNGKEGRPVKDENKKCPRCQEGMLVKRTSKKRDTKHAVSSFIGCSRYPKCRYTEDLKI